MSLLTAITQFKTESEMQKAATKLQGGSATGTRQPGSDVRPAAPTCTAAHKPSPLNLSSAPLRLRFVIFRLVLSPSRHFDPLSQNRPFPMTQKPVGFPARPTSELSSWPTSPCSVHSVDHGHSPSPLDDSWLFLSYALFFRFLPNVVYFITLYATRSISSI